MGAHRNLPCLLLLSLWFVSYSVSCALSIPYRRFFFFVALILPSLLHLRFYYYFFYLLFDFFSSSWFASWSSTALWVIWEKMKHILLLNISYALTISSSLIHTVWCALKSICIAQYRKRTRKKRKKIRSFCDRGDGGGGGGCCWSNRLCKIQFNGQWSLF